MYLRNNILLKYLIILLFAFELVAPAFVPTKASPGESQTVISSLDDGLDHIDFIASMFLGESGIEERAEKFSSLHDTCCIEIFSELKKFEPSVITWQLPKEKYNSQPSLFTLHRVLLL